MPDSPPGHARFPRTHRLTRRSEFDAVMKAGSRSRDACFHVYLLGSETPLTRLGLTVAKRVSVKAVERNRIKRQIRESFRKHRALLAGLSVVVTAQPPAATKNNRQLCDSLNGHWERATHLCKKSRRES